MEAVQIVTIKNKIPLFKGEEQANTVELIELEEAGYELVANKTLYQIGDKAVFIQPDYNLSDISLFDSFIRPNGDESKSMLGKVDGQARRIRAKKFNFSKVPNGDPVYSNGILLPYNEVQKYINDNGNFMKIDLWAFDLTEKLGITKYEEPEYNIFKKDKRAFPDGFKGNLKFPEDLYKTDEKNINNCWNYLENEITYPVTLVGTEKIDGSSITIGVTDKFPNGFICSRNLRKPLTIKKITGKRNKTLLETLLFWKKFDLNIYIETENDDDFVKYGLPLLNEIKEITYLYSKLVLRGELNGITCKGSGNKNNPASKEQNNIKLFGIDTIDKNGYSVKLPYNEFIRIASYYDFNRVKTIFNKSFNSKEEILQECNNYFKNNLIEGIVIRTLDSKFSAKVMNLYYDSKK